jgi:hypothetical protein
MKLNNDKITASAITCFVLLLLLSLGGQTSIAIAQASGTFTATGNMTTPRGSHSATLLTNGKVLIAGGTQTVYPHETILASAELYDPSTGTFTPTGSMTASRSGHTATLLADGTVLIIGGYGPGRVFEATAELYDPLTETFTTIGRLTTDHIAQTATLLDNGKVLIAEGGGPCGTPLISACPTAAAAELYDPDTATFAVTNAYTGMPAALGVSTANLLRDGKVLLTGFAADAANNSDSWTQLYDPHSDTFSLTDTPSLIWWDDHVMTATLLMNGQVLFAGSDEFDFPADAAVYDPAAGAFTRIGKAIDPHEFSAAVLLPDGTVLISGSQLIGGGADAHAELYIPSTGNFVPAGNMTAARFGHTITLLRDGTALIAGGASPYFTTSTSTAELYTPFVLMPAPTLLSISGDGQGQGFILHSATGQVASPDNPATAGERVQIYCTGFTDGSVIPPQVTIGGRMAEAVSFGNAPGWTGVTQVNVRVPSGVTSAAPVRLRYIGRPSNEVTIAIQ